jgi:hypothetical protein
MVVRMSSLPVSGFQSAKIFDYWEGFMPRAMKQLKTRLICRSMTAEEERRFRITVQGFLNTLVNEAIKTKRSENGQERSAGRTQGCSDSPLQRRKAD